MSILTRLSYRLTGMLSPKRRASRLQPCRSSSRDLTRSLRRMLKLPPPMLPPTKMPMRMLWLAHLKILTRWIVISAAMQRWRDEGRQARYRSFVFVVIFLVIFTTASFAFLQFLILFLGSTCAPRYFYLWRQHLGEDDCDGLRAFLIQWTL